MFKYDGSPPSARRVAAAGCVALATVAGLAAAPATAASPDRGPDRRAGALPVLTGTVGPDFTISFSEDSIPAGRYKVVVKDKGTIHNFHVFGQGVDKATSIPGTGKTVWKIRFREGTYTIQCDPHSSTMKTTLNVT